MRIAVNHLLGSLVASRVINSNGKFSFRSWDECFTDYSLFSMEGLHPSQEGNLWLHGELKAYLCWFISEDRHHAHNRVVDRVRAELQRTRQEARHRDWLKMMAANRASTSENQHISHLVRRRRSSRRHYRNKRRGSHPRTNVPMDIPPTTPTLDVAGCVVVRPQLSGWGLRVDRPASRTVRHCRVHVNRRKPLSAKRKSPVTCPTCCKMCRDDNALLDHHLIHAHLEDNRVHQSKAGDKREHTHT